MTKSLGGKHHSEIAKYRESDLGSITVGTVQPSVTVTAPEISFPYSTSRAQRRPPKLASYDVKLDDEKSYGVVDIAFTNDGRILLADFENCKIKLFSREMKRLCSVSLLSRPWCIAVTGDIEAIVSSAEAYLLHILDMADSTMNIKGTVQLPFTIAGIASYKDKLLVIAWSTTPRSVKLIDRSGIVYWSTATDQQGQELFSYPRYLACCSDESSAAVVISDSGNDTLTVLRLYY